MSKPASKLLPTSESFQGGKMTSTDRSIEIGGADWLPEYPFFYFEAARRLLSASGADLGPVALPLVYLQRQCLELIIKEMHLASLFLSAAKLTSEGKWIAPGRPPELHRLVDLVVALGQSLGEHSLTMPTDLESLAKEMDALESSSPDRYRYAWKRLTKKQKASGQGPEESFATPQRLPVREIQNRLEPLALAADIRKEDSLVFKLYTECTTVLNLNLGVASGEVSFDSDV